MSSAPGPLALVLFQVAAILVTARVFGALARRVGQPQVVAEILAGIALGPSLLGLVWPQAMDALFDASSLTGLKVLSQLGLVLFMFQVGVELDRSHIKQHLRTVLSAAFASTAFPALFGALAAVGLYAHYRGELATQPAFVAFLALAMGVSALPVMARIIAEQKLGKTKVATIALACAGVKDLVLWCALPFLVAFATPKSESSTLATGGFGLAFLLLVMFGVRPLLAKVCERADQKQTSSSAALGTVVGGLLATAAVAEWIGIHALVGAFLYGAVMPRNGVFRSTLASKLEPVVVSILLPLFFAWSGLRTQVGALGTTQDALVFAALAGMASLGAMGGGAAAGLATGLSPRESTTLGVLLNTRGLMELVVLNIGLDLGLLSPALFTVMVLVALSTTVLATPLLKLLQPKGSAALRFDGSRPMTISQQAIADRIEDVTVTAPLKVGRDELVTETTPSSPQIEVDVVLATETRPTVPARRWPERN
jgi:Kef-type K+ transport system membrane component KefB